jgi:ribosomal protein L40E
MVKICINCNAENLEEALFCKKCGTKLPTLKEVENARREEQEAADRKWKEEVAKTRQQNEVLNETRRNEGSVAVYGSSDNLNLPQTNNTPTQQPSTNHYTPPTRRPRPNQHKEEATKRLNSTSLIIINLSIILILAIGVFGYFYMSKDGVSIHNFTQEIINNSQSNKVAENAQNLEDIVIDKDRKLMWQDDADSKKMILTWKEADEHCDNLFLGDNTGWRIPSKSELNSLIDSNNFPAIKKSFRNVSPTFYWANPIKSGSSFAWHIFFGKGGGIDYEDMQNLNSVRCVRNY